MVGEFGPWELAEGRGRVRFRQRGKCDSRRSNSRSGSSRTLLDSNGDSGLLVVFPPTAIFVPSGITTPLGAHGAQGPAPALRTPVGRSGRAVADDGPVEEHRQIDVHHRLVSGLKMLLDLSDVRRRRNAFEGSAEYVGERRRHRSCQRGIGLGSICKVRIGKPFFAPLSEAGAPPPHFSPCTARSSAMRMNR